MKRDQNSNVAAIRQAYSQFLNKGQVARGLVPEFIERSWRRSAAYGVLSDRIRDVARINEADLRGQINKFGRLISAATPVMENLYCRLAGSGSVVLLCSGDGMIVHSMGDPEFLPRAQRVALKPGVSWAEQQKGTNAIGTAIVEREPVVVYAGHHYVRQNHFLACTARPVVDPAGEVAGVLDITCDYRGHQRHTMALIDMAVRVIERQLFQHRYRDDLVFNVHPQAVYLGSPFDVQLAFSETGILLAASPSTCAVLNLAPGSSGARFEEMFDISIEQIQDRLHCACPQPVQVSMYRGRLPVHIQPISGSRRASPHSRVEISPVHSTPARDGADSIPRSPTLASLDSSDPVIAAALEKIRRVLGRHVPILIVGEAGTGKEWLARAIHNSSPRRGGELVAVHCSGEAGHPVEADLFGGTELDAKGNERGLAGHLWSSGGTLLLHDVGNLPLPLQARLLHALEERSTALREGSPATAPIAIICTTRQSLWDRVQASLFREDLFYFLEGLTVTLPALRERQDVLPLARTLIAQESSRKEEVVLSEEAGEILARHRWPGNLRQLRLVIRTAIALLGAGRVIERQHLPPRFLEESRPHSEQGTVAMTQSGPESLDHIACQAMRNAVQECDGNIAAAARRLHISRTTLYRRLKIDGNAPDAGSR